MASSFKSKLVRIGTIDYSKSFIIEQLFADPKMLEVHAQRLKNIYKNASDEFMRHQIDNIIIRENAFNLIMQYLVTLYQITFDSTEVSVFVSKLKPQFPEAKDEMILDLAKKLITKGLVFEDLAQANQISITDDQAKEYLENYYKTTNNSINEFLNNPEKFKEIKGIILEERITQWLIDKFKVSLNIKNILNRQIPINNFNQNTNPSNSNNFNVPNINK